MKILKYTYLVLSGLSFLILLGVIFLIFYSYSPLGIKHSFNPIFTLNHGNIDTNQNFEVIFSHQSPPSFNGDHADYYCVQLEKFKLQSPKENEWHFGQETNLIFKQARDLAARAGNINECFSDERNSESGEIAAKIWSVDANRFRVEGAVVIFYHNVTKRLLYVSFQT